MTSCLCRYRSICITSNSTLKTGPLKKVREQVRILRKREYLASLIQVTLFLAGIQRTSSLEIPTSWTLLTHFWDTSMKMSLIRSTAERSILGMLFACLQSKCLRIAMIIFWLVEICLGGPWMSSQRGSQLLDHSPCTFIGVPRSVDEEASLKKLEEPRVVLLSPSDEE